MTSSVDDRAGNSPEEVRHLAKRLSEVQMCRVEIRLEANGYQLYLPCPGCLRTHGKRELAEPKYALNASKYLGIGKWKSQGLSASFGPGLETTDEDQRDARAGVCMRTYEAGPGGRHIYAVSDLLNMPSIPERHKDLNTRAEVVGGKGHEDKKVYWKPDPDTGELCPPLPGKGTPIVSLPQTHVARYYLEKRGYDVFRLHSQFRCEFCYEEHPHGTDDIWYYGKGKTNRWPAGWADTPQGRVIFFSLEGGTRRTWQGRYIEDVSNDGLYKTALNPYTFQWDVVESRASISAPWMRVPPFDRVDADGNYVWKPSKYKTAKHSFKFPMGWDLALRRAHYAPFPYCVLCEGPLDAARVGPGGLAVMGKSVSDVHASMIAKHFKVVFLGFDNDIHGKTAATKLESQLFRAAKRGGILSSVVPLPVIGGKDLGDMRQEYFDRMFSRIVKKTKRTLGI